MGVNSVGLTRSNFNKEKIKEISDIYHTLFIEKNSTSAALEKIEKTFPASAERDGILQFVRSSKSGIIKRPSKTNDEDNPF